MSKLLNKGGYGIIDLTKYTIPVSTESASKPATPAIIGGVFDYVKKMLGSNKPTVVMGVVTTPAVANIETKSSTKYSLNAIADGYAYSIFVTSDNEVWAYKSALAGGGGGGATELSDLDDVDLDGVTNGQILKWNSTTEKWENADESGGGGSADYQIVDVASATLWADISALDYTKPVFIKRGNYCVPVSGVRITANTRYVFYFVDMTNRHSLTVNNTDPVSFSVSTESLSGLFHYYRGNFMNASATIATGEYSEDVTVQSGFGSVATIVDLLGETQIVEGSFGNGETRYLPFTVALTDVDAGITSENVPFVLAVTYNGSGSVKLGDAEVYVKGSTRGYTYKVIPNKTLFDLNAGTPEELSFTVHRVSDTDDYVVGHEVLTNKTFNGEPVYRKVYSISGADLKVDWTGMNLELTSDMSKLLSVEGMALRSDGYTILPYYKDSNNALAITALLRHADGGVIAYCLYSSNGGTATITMLNIGIEYTKATS